MNQQSNAAKILANQIEDAAGEVSEQLSSEAMNSRKTGVTCDDISAAMMEYLGEVEGVRKLPGGAPIAFDLVMRLGRYSYGELGDGDFGGSGYGNRPSDPVMDKLLSKLARERRREEPSWDYEKALKIMKERDAWLRQFGIYNFCSKSIKLLPGWGTSAASNVDLTSSQ